MTCSLCSAAFSNLHAASVFPWRVLGNMLGPVFPSGPSGTELHYQIVRSNNAIDLTAQTVPAFFEPVLFQAFRHRILVFASGFCHCILVDPSISMLLCLRQPLREVSCCGLPGDHRELFCCLTW
jgi:hypothetical protein